MFVLASASKARQKLLDQVGLQYEVIISGFDESKIQESDPCLKALALAKAKECRDCVLSTLLSFS